MPPRVVWMRYPALFHLYGMNFHLTRPPTLRAPLVLTASLLYFMASCGGSGDAIELARKHLRRGELVEAEHVLAAGQGRAIEQLREDIQVAKWERAEFLLKVEAACGLSLASDSAAALRELAGMVPDPVCQATFLYFTTF